MDWNNFFDFDNEQPLDCLVDGYSNTAVFDKIAFIGDSLSSGEFELMQQGGQRSYHDMYWYSWGQYIARKNGITGLNFSRGGMTAREYMHGYAESMGWFATDKACKAYVIALGVNDIYNQNQPIGTANDVNTADYTKNADTFMGNYAAIVSRYKQISPDAKFFFVTFAAADPAYPQFQTQGMIDALQTLAGLLQNCYVINLYKYGPVYNQEFMRRYYLNNHMTPAGYIFTARLIDSYIDYIVRHNPADFAYAALIGTGITHC